VPIYDFLCSSQGCEHHKKPFEKYLYRRDSDNPRCPLCGSETSRAVSRFGIVWTGYITKKYNDPGYAHSDREGHIAWRVRSSKTGKPEPVRIETFEQQRRFVKGEGLYNPTELPPSGGEV